MVRRPSDDPRSVVLTGFSAGELESSSSASRCCLGWSISPQMS